MKIREGLVTLVHLKNDWTNVILCLIWLKHIEKQIVNKHVINKVNECTDITDREAD